MKTQSKIALILFSSNVLIVVLFGVAMYYSLYKYSYNDFYKRLETRASIAAQFNFNTNKLSAEAFKLLREQHFERLPDEKEYIINLSDSASIKEASVIHQIPASLINQIKQYRAADSKEGNLFYSGIIHTDNNIEYAVIVSARNYYATHHLYYLRNIVAIGILCLLVITVCFAVYFSKRIFQPIKKITDRVKEISSENIHLRLDEIEGNDNTEINELKSTFNDLLNRIETAFETQKNFISNASHELGTPLTSIIGEADVALIKERTPAEYQEALQNISSQAERLDQITKSLVFLAQTGYKGNNIPFEIFRTDEILWEVKQVIDKLNPQNKIYIDLSLLPEEPKKLKIKGNKQLLHLAISNILSNACKYSHNKPVAVSIAASNNQVIIIVKDEGVGIPPSEIKYIYDPFFRASNTSYFEGYGIGLPLARNIILLHKGSLDVYSEPGKGTSVHMHFPLHFIGLS
jgi:signal transduction histidine kinase